MRNIYNKILTIHPIPCCRIAVKTIKMNLFMTTGISSLYNSSNLGLLALLISLKECIQEYIPNIFYSFCSALECCNFSIRDTFSFTRFKQISTKQQDNGKGEEEILPGLIFMSIY